MKFKSILFFLSTLLFSFSLYAQQKKVAVVTIYADKYIDFSQLNSTAALVASIGQLSEDPNFNLQPIVNNFHDLFFETLVKGFPFEFLPENDVLNNPAYQAYESKGQETSDGERSKLFQRYTTYPGYKPLLEYLGKESKNELKMLEIFGNEVDGVMFIYLDFAFVPRIAVAGVGSAGIRSYCKIKLWNAEGKKVFSINEYAMSKKSVGMVAGIPVTDTKEILPLCEDASSQLFGDLINRIPKKASKITKKL